MDNAKRKYLDESGLRILWEAIKDKFIDNIELADYLKDYVKVTTFEQFKEAIQQAVNNNTLAIDELRDIIDQIHIPEYSLIKKDSAEYAAVYRLTKDGQEIGAEIDIAKDQFFQGASVETCTVKDVPVAGLEVGDKYLDLRFGADSEHIQHAYIPVKDMIKPYTAGSGIQITSDNVINVINKTDRLITSDQGAALMFNEADGGGAKFEHADGSESFVGVNSDGKDGLMAQIYADVQKDGKWSGSRINVYNNKIYYQSQAKTDADVAKNDASLEIATVGDVAKKVEKDIQSASGKAMIFNEADGGGAKFEHSDGTESFVGVNNGGEDGLMAQIYADKLVDGKWQGAKIDVTNGAIYYTVGDKAFSERAVAGNEIATIADVEAAEPDAMSEQDIRNICK